MVVQSHADGRWTKGPSDSPNEVEPPSAGVGVVGAVGKFSDLALA
ncbi:MAG: hypothetical protein QOC71_1981 [Thermoplasmata archaeon]|nr:hypothetical protein [Thermoplasmata archaeon]